MSPRAVGSANGANPISIIVPCHRVIGSDGSLTGYGGGLQRKRALLDLEAATIQGEPPAGVWAARQTSLLLQLRAGRGRPRAPLVPGEVIDDGDRVREHRRRPALELVGRPSPGRHRKRRRPRSHAGRAGRG